MGGSSETGVSLTGPGHVISFHVPKEHLKMMEKQQMVMREDFGTERHSDPFSSLLGGELLPPVLRKIQKNKIEQKGSKLTKSSVNEVESSTSKKQRGEGRRSGRFNNGRNRKNKRNKNKNKSNKHNRISKSKSTTTTTTPTTTTSRATSRITSTTKRPRGGRKVGSSKRRNISVK